MITPLRCWCITSSDGCVSPSEVDFIPVAFVQRLLTANKDI